MTNKPGPVKNLKLAFTSLWQNRNIIWEMTKKEVTGKYKGSFLGIFWAFLNPIIMLSIYTFVFSVILKARWGNSQYTEMEFAVILFCGLIIYFLFAECMAKAPHILLRNISYIKKTIFPVEILPVVAVLSSMFHAALSILALLIMYLMIFGHINLSMVFLPFILFPYILFLLGLIWFLSALSAFVKDIEQALTMVTSAFLFLSPIFYPASAAPEKLKFVFFLNPLTVIIEQTRATLILGNTPDWLTLLIYSLFGALSTILGLLTFMSLKKKFPEVL